jgi:Kyakuja-Dileera-Zisupton transposase
MRKLQVSKRFGQVYDISSPPGSLTIFCPSCPQPGINLPPDWKDLPNWVTRRTITVDGNFHADHIKMRRQDLDVMLTNGDGYMVEDVRYREYLSEAKEPRFVGIFFNFLGFSPFLLILQRPSCRNHKAVNAANSNNRRHLDATGVIACCCARHGCFIPTSVCDTQKGER